MTKDDEKLQPMAVEIAMSSDPLIPAGYGDLLAAIRERIRSAQFEALRAVNRQLVELYWEIGRMIVEQQEHETWGRSVVERLAEDLQAELPGVSGYSARKLWYMRQFYLAYRGKPKLQPLAAEISGVVSSKTTRTPLSASCPARARAAPEPPM